MTARVSSRVSCGAERLAVGAEAAEATGAVPHGVMAGEVAADEDPEPGTGAAAGLLGHPHEARQFEYRPSRPGAAAAQ